MGVGAHPELTGSGNTGNASQGGPVPPMGGEVSGIGKQRRKTVTGTPQGWDEMGKCAGPSAGTTLTPPSTKTPRPVMGGEGGDGGGKPVNIGTGVYTDGP